MRPRRLLAAGNAHGGRDGCSGAGSRAQRMRSSRRRGSSPGARGWRHLRPVVLAEVPRCRRRSQRCSRPAVLAVDYARGGRGGSGVRGHAPRVRSADGAHGASSLPAALAEVLMAGGACGHSRRQWRSRPCSTCALSSKVHCPVPHSLSTFPSVQINSLIPIELSNSQIHKSAARFMASATSSTDPHGRIHGMVGWTAT